MEVSVRGLILVYYPRICLDGLWNTTKDLRNDSRSPGRVSNFKGSKLRT
jgi:hypothetical protein